MPKPAPLTFWQKILKAIGLYKEPVKPPRSLNPQQPATEKPARTEPKSNTRNARGSRGGEGRSEGRSEGRGGEGRGSGGNRRSSRGGDPSTVESTRVYVGNLSYDVSEEDLRELFKGIGSVRSAEIVYNRSTHRSKGYGFVEMITKEEAERSVEVLHDQPFMGRNMVVSGAKGKGQDEREEQDDRPEHPVVVAPLPAEITAEESTAVVVEEVTHSLVAEEEAPAAEMAANEEPASEEEAQQA